MGKRAGWEHFQLAMSNWRWPLGSPGGLGDPAGHRECDASIWQEPEPSPASPRARRSFQLLWDLGWTSPHSSQSHLSSCHPADSKKHLPKLQTHGRSRTRVKLDLRSSQAGLEGGPASPWQPLCAETLAKEPKGGLETWKPLSE